MSIRLLSEQLQYKLSPRDRVVLASFCDHAGYDNDIAWPSVARVAWETDLSVPTVQRSIAQFRKQGVLLTIANGHGGNATTRYRIDLTKLERKTAFQVGQRGRKLIPLSESEQLGVSDEPKGVSTETQTGITAVMHEPLVEPERESEKNQTSNSLSATQTSEMGLFTNESTTSSIEKKEKASTPDSGYIATLFEHYVEQLGKSPTRYLLTPKRLSMAKHRWQEAWEIVRNEFPNIDDHRHKNRVANMMKHAIDALAASSFHVDNGYDDWEQIFRSAENFQKWVDRYYNPVVEKDRRPTSGPRVYIA